MADFEYHAAQAKPGKKAAGRSKTQLIGAVSTVVLGLGFAVWAVQLVLRDTTEIPVIQAIQEPMRVEPTDPGGQTMAHQGLAVNEIRAGGTAAAAANQVVLAPEPVVLDESNRQAAPLPATPTNNLVAAPEPLQTASLSTSNLAESPVLQNVVPASVGGVIRSARPLQRPARVRQASASRPATAATQSTTFTSGLDVQVSDIPSGTRLVQLGAFDDPETARREWDRLYGTFGEYMQGKKRLVMKATSAGRDFYRLRVVGFNGPNETRQFCSVFLARNTACIPVVSR